MTFDWTWRDDAACPGDLDPDAWFPSGQGNQPDPAALAICATCPVADPCLEEALAMSQADDHGIWGQTTHRQRRYIRRGELTVEKAREGNDGVTACKVPTCGRDVRSRGWCDPHYQRWLNHGDVRADVPIGTVTSNTDPCAVEDCERDSRARGWCEPHYRRWTKYGDVLANVPIGNGGVALMDREAS